MSAGGVINIYTPQYEKLTFDVSVLSYFSLSFLPIDVEYKHYQKANESDENGTNNLPRRGEHLSHFKPGT